MYSSSNNVAPPAYPAGFNSAFNNGINVVAGEVYVLVVSNFSNSSAGFTIIFSKNAPISYASSGTSSTWSGGIDNSWFKPQNWGGCPVPSCTRDAVINGSISIQPAINSSGAYARSVIINPGATLTLSSGQLLNVCQDFINFGTFSAATNSTLVFANGNVPQNLNGSMISPNSIGGLTVNKNGVVTLLQNAEVKGNFLISGGTFNANGKLHKQGGNFSNYGSYTANSGILEFNGNASQLYINTSTLPLDNVIMSHNGPGVTLNNNLLISAAGKLTLTSGKIITAGITEVSVLNRIPVSVNAGNSTSYIEGSLRRYISSTGSYDFPVGHSAKGYEWANINFAYPGNSTIIDNIMAAFQPYSTIPAAINSSNCSAYFSSPALNNGKWIFTPSNNATSGNFNLTLHNLNYSNPGNVWTIMSNFGTTWTLANGACSPSPVTAVSRTGMNNINGSFGTAQGPAVLPVSLISVELFSLNTSIQVKWKTASEENNKGFSILRSEENGIFYPLGWVNGAVNSSELKEYNFFDFNVSTHVKYYYRLEQTDLNGIRTLSNIVSIKMNENEEAQAVFPNPVTDGTTLTFISHQTGSCDIEAVNAMGERTLLLRNQSLKEGVNQVFIYPEKYALKPGLYDICIRSAYKTIHVKLLFAGK